MHEFWRDLLIFAPGVMLAWAAMRRAEAMVIRARRDASIDTEGE